MLKRALALLAALPLLLVVAWLLWSWHSPAPEVWQHLRAWVLPEALANTGWLLLGVGLIVSVLGVACGWLNAVCDYPGRRWVDLALVLPLALPTYVMAYAWVGLSDFSGPIQTPARAIGVDLRHWLNLATPLGASIVLGLALFPYVYVPVRASLMARGWSSFEAARTLGLRPMQAFCRVSLPLLWPAWAAGISLALMETLADLGAVSILNYPTLTSAIFKTWFGLQSLAAAAQLASALLGGVVLLLLLERWARRGRGFSERTGGTRQRLNLSRGAGLLVLALMLFVLALAFVLPLVYLLGLGLQSSAAIADAQLVRAALQSLLLGLGSALILAALALLMSALQRAARADRVVDAAAFVVNLGYALPGVVLALGLLLALISLENTLRAWMGWELLLSSGVVALMGAYVVRFFRVAHAPVAAAMAQVKPALLDQARLYRLSRVQRVRRVWAPLLRPGLYSALILVSVEVIKELPATLMLRPFGFETLATRIYALTSEGDWQRAAWPALILVLVGLLPVVVLMLRSRSSRR